MDDLFSSKSTEDQETAVLTDTAETEEPVAASEVPSLELPKEPSVPLMPGVTVNKPTSYPPILGIPSEEKPAMIDPETFKLERSLSTLGYLLVLIVMQIPIVGLILTIVWACSAKKKSLRSLSRAMIIIWILMIILGVACYLFVSTHSVLVTHWLNTFKDFFRFLK